MAERKVAWTAPARDDLLQVVDYIAEDDPVAAGRVLERLLGRAASLEQMAERGRRVPELHGMSDHCPRELIVRPWRLFYVIEGDKVYVTALFDGRRDVERLLQDRFVRSRMKA